jgi:GT2 family glycosyltransferase
MTPRLSVVIVTYQSQDDIVVCIRSVLRSTVRCELIVIDNASTDATLQRTRAMIGRRRDCRILCNRENVGFAKAVNQGLSLTSAPYILLLNPDCVLEPDTLALALAALEHNPAAGAAGCMLLNEDGSEQAGARRQLPTPWRSLSRVLLLHKLFPGDERFSGFLMHHRPLPSTPVEVEATSGAFMLVRRTVVEQVGALDEGYFMHCEDLDWCVRIRGAGWHILFVPTARALHRKGRSSRARPIRVELYKHIGMVRFYRKFFRERYPGVLLGAVMVAVWVRFAIKATVMLPGLAWTHFAALLGRPDLAAPHSALRPGQATQRTLP